MISKAKYLEVMAYHDIIRRMWITEVGKFAQT